MLIIYFNVFSLCSRICWTLSHIAHLHSILKELNKELSRKLEIQTQRLELLTSQSMAGESAQSKVPELDPVLDDAAYADEGDEVRVLMILLYSVVMKYLCFEGEFSSISLYEPLLSFVE